MSQISSAMGDLAQLPLPSIQPAADSRLPGSQPAVIAGTEPAVALPPINHEGELALDFDIGARRRYYNFFELSYRGSLEYKHGLDARGYRLLIEHENEIAPFGTSPDGTAPDLKNRPDGDANQSNRYSRRLRLAVYENHVAPIIEKVIGYLTRNAPTRSERVQAEQARLKLDETIVESLRSALMLTQYFVGFDAAKAVTGLPTRPTAAQAQAADPSNALKPYLLSVDPRRVLDVDYDRDGNVIRFCYEEETRTKASVISKPENKYRYKEWFPTHYVVYEPVEDAAAAAKGKDPDPKQARVIPTDGMKVRVIEANLHSFKRVPFANFQPRFPTETLCDINRAIFNLSSLLQEELYNNTFTQFYILGVRTEDVKNTNRGTGNAVVIENPQARIGTFGAVDGQAQQLREAIDDLREQIYTVVSMNETATKNVAESAEKKKRDMEALYTMLLTLTKEMETLENNMLCGMGLADADKEETLTKYADRFDVQSVAELLAELDALKGVPFAPASLKRSLTTQLAKKMDPFGPDHTDDIENAFDTSPDLVGSIVDLSTIKGITPELIVSALGIPEEFQQGIIDQMAIHNDPLAMPQLDEFGNPLPPGQLPPGAAPDPNDPNAPPTPPGATEPGQGPPGTQGEDDDDEADDEPEPGEDDDKAEPKPPAEGDKAKPPAKGKPKGKGNPFAKAKK